MKTSTRIALAAALVAGAIGTQTSIASAMPGLHVDTALATSNDGVTIDRVGLVCGRFACVRTYGYGYGYRPYRAWYGAYGYNPYAYRYAVPAVRYGYY